MRLLHKVSQLQSAILFATLLVILFLLLLVSCQQGETTATPNPPFADSIPRFLKRIEVTPLVNQAVVHPNKTVYFISDVDIAVISEVSLIKQIPLPNFEPPYGQLIQALDVNTTTGLIYVLDSFADAIHVISNTELITTLIGIAEQPHYVINDRDSGEIYIFYTSLKSGKPLPRAVVLAETQMITNIILPVFPEAVRYNPIDGHIYVVGYASPINPSRENALAVINNHQVITMVHPLDIPHLAVEDLAINPKTGDVYVLLVTKVIYWDRVNALRSLDLYAQGYKNFECITVDPNRGWAYICSWPGRPSYVLVVDKDQLKAAIPVAHWPDAAAADASHDYVYVGHYDPTNLSVIRGTDLITTLNIVGFGTMNVTVDEEQGYIYTSNADDGSISVFGFQPEIEDPPFWQRFLPLIGR